MPNPNRSASAATKPKPKYHNRIGAIMLHTVRYSCFPTSRLAADSGLAKSTISHLIHGRVHPLYNTVVAVVNCLERETGRHLETMEVFSKDGCYPTASVCQLLGCSPCKPPIVYGAGTDKRAALAFVVAGQWTGDNFEFENISQQERSQ